jgi:hypothetical protein
MNSKGILQMGGFTVSLLLAGSLYLSYRNQKRDTLTQELLTELRKELNPSTQGLPGLDALSKDYLGNLRKSLKSGVSILVMRDKDAAAMADRIYNAFGTFNDEEEKIYQVLRELKDKVQVSQVSAEYEKSYGVSLTEEFTDKLSDSEIKTVIDIIKSKSAYRKG